MGTHTGYLNTLKVVNISFKDGTVRRGHTMVAVHQSNVAALPLSDTTTNITTENQPLYCTPTGHM